MQEDLHWVYYSANLGQFCMLECCNLGTVCNICARTYIAQVDNLSVSLCITSIYRQRKGLSK